MWTLSIILLAGILPLCFRASRRRAVVLTIVWAVPALLLGGLHWVALFLPEANPLLTSVLVRERWLGKLYTSIPLAILLVCGANAVICYVVALTRKVAWRKSVPLGALVLLALAGPAITTVHGELFIRQALRQARATAFAHPDDALDQFDYARWLEGVGKLRSALAAAEKARRLDHDRHWYFAHEVGEVFLLEGQWSEALAPLARAYHLQQAERPYQSRLAKSLKATGVPAVEIRKLVGDKSHWKSLVQDDNETVAISYVRALVLNDRWSQATNIAQASVSRLPKDIFLRKVYILLLWGQGRDGEAAAQLSRLPRAAGLADWAHRYREPAAARRKLRDWAR